MRYVLLTLLFILAACAQPVTTTPTLDPQEVARERELQQQIAQQEKPGAPASLSAAEVKARAQRVADRVVPAGKEVCRDMYGPDYACDFRVGIAKEGPVNAYADGQNIVVTPAMVAFANADAELAMVLAHEYAHNILRHPESMQINTVSGGVVGSLIDALAASQGYQTGDAFGQMGAQYGAMRYSVDFEKEADYVGLYVLSRAGYNLSDATNFWRRMSALDERGIYGGQTHPSNPDRFVFMNRTIQEIDAKKNAGRPVLPEVHGDRFGF